MRSMVLLIDTNVLIDYLAKREEYFDEARSVLQYCTQAEVRGYVAFHSLPNIWYVLRKRTDEERRESLKEICSILTVVGASHKEVLRAIEQTDFKDFEDCLQDRCAVGVKADYIITRNTKDFVNSATKVITPNDFCLQFLK